MIVQAGQASAPVEIKLPVVETAMIRIARPSRQRLLVKTVTVTFVTVSALLRRRVLLRPHDRSRSGAADRRRQPRREPANGRCIGATASARSCDRRPVTLAESPTLKAALDTYATEGAGGDEYAHVQLLATIKRELDKLAARVEADAIIWSMGVGTSLAAVGRLARPLAGWAFAAAGRAAGRLDDEFDRRHLRRAATLFRAVR